MTSGSPFNLTCQDGIVAWKKDSLASDPSIIVGYPRAPGSFFFHVDDVLQIKPGNLILFSTEAETSPDRVRKACVALHKGRKDFERLIPGDSRADDLKADIERLETEIFQYYNGEKQVMSLRQVLSVDKARKLIVIKDSFIEGYYPRVFGHCSRVLGFVEEMVSEKDTDKLHELARKVYGSYDWEAEFNETGKFPTLGK